MDFQQLDQIDRFFDRYTPYIGVSTLSGVGRMLYGSAELITGLARATLFGLSYLFSEGPDARFNGVKFSRSFVHIFMGTSNIIKGAIEAVPLVNFLVYAHNTEAQGAYVLFRQNWNTFPAMPQADAAVGPV